MPFGEQSQRGQRHELAFAGRHAHEGAINLYIGLLEFRQHSREIFRRLLLQQPEEREGQVKKVKGYAGMADGSATPASGAAQNTSASSANVSMRLSSLPKREKAVTFMRCNCFRAFLLSLTGRVHFVKAPSKAVSWLLYTYLSSAFSLQIVYSHCCA